MTNCKETIMETIIMEGEEEIVGTITITREIFIS